MQKKRMEQLYEFFNRKLKSTPTGFLRYKYGKIKWDGRAFGIVGPRGVGKSTMILQHIRLIRETFFMNQTRVMNDVTSSAISDFEINGKVFEIGGRKKGQKQIENAGEGYIVKDDIESGYANVIPLWAFGMNY